MRETVLPDVGLEQSTSMARAWSVLISVSQTVEPQRL
jgi:hypothetical protein